MGLLRVPPQDPIVGPWGCRSHGHGMPVTRSWGVRDPLPGVRDPVLGGSRTPLPGGPGTPLRGAENDPILGGPGGVKNGPFWGSPEGSKIPPFWPPREGGPGTPREGVPGPPGRGPGGRKLAPENHPFLFLMPTSVPTGRVIKYPRKCTPGGPGRPPGPPRPGGAPDPPKWGVRDPLPGGSPGGVRDPQNTPARTPQNGGSRGTKIPPSGTPCRGARTPRAGGPGPAEPPDWMGTWRSRCRPLSRI